MSNIALFGGAFDPIHIGHLFIASKVYEQLDVEKVVFMPTGIAPHKKIFSSTDEDRLAMLKMSTDGIDEFEVSTYEMDKKEVSYTVNTLEHLRSVYDKVYLVVGDDSFMYFEKWFDYKTIIELSEIALYVRHHSISALKDKANSIGAKVNIIEGPVIPVSSSYIREEVIRGNSVKYLVTDEVNRYILKKGLYESI